MKLIFIFFVGVMLNLAFAGEEFVNRFKLFNDFDKFLSKDHNSYEIFLDGNAEFYADEKYSQLPDEDPKGQYKDSPEFVIKEGRLFHKGKLICDIKDGYPVPVNEVRPNNLTERQKEMTICIYLPFVYYKKEYSKKGQELINGKEANYSIRVILKTGGRVKKISFKDKNLYQKVYSTEEWGDNYVSVLNDLKKYKECKDNLLADNNFLKDYEEAVACGVRKDLNCLKKFFPTPDNKAYKETLDNARRIYGEGLSWKQDGDLMFLLQYNISSSSLWKKYLLNQNNEAKLSDREIHRRAFADTISRLFKLLPNDDFVCRPDGKYSSLNYFFFDKFMEHLSFYKDDAGKFRFKYSLEYSLPYRYQD